jgi:hypothetical protein
VVSGGGRRNGLGVGKYPGGFSYLAGFQQHQSKPFKMPPLDGCASLSPKGSGTQVDPFETANFEKSVFFTNFIGFKG